MSLESGRQRPACHPYWQPGSIRALFSKAALRSPCTQASVDGTGRVERLAGIALPLPSATALFGGEERSGAAPSGCRQSGWGVMARRQAPTSTSVNARVLCRGEREAGARQLCGEHGRTGGLPGLDNWLPDARLTPEGAWGHLLGCSSG